MSAEELEYFGKHLILDLQDCRTNVLGTESVFRTVVSQLLEITRMTPIQPLQLVYYIGSNPEDSGVSAIQMLAESHISLHSFDQKGWLYADIFSCRSFDAAEIISYLEEIFAPQITEMRIIPRGHGFPRSISDTE